MLGRTGKQFLRYYIFFFLCLVILFVPLYQINLSMVSRTYMDAAGSLLETGLANMESDLVHIKTIARTVYDNPRFRRLSYIQGAPELTDYYYTISLVDDFKRYFASAGMIVDSGILYENGMILTAKRLYFPWEEFYGAYFLQEGLPTFDQWIGELDAGFLAGGFVPLRSFITREGSYGAITLCVVFSNSPRNKAFFFATLEKNYILSRLATDEVLKNGRILVSDPAGNIIIDSGAAGEEEDVITLETVGRKQGIHVRVDIKRRVFRERLAPFQRLAFVFALAYLALGIVLSLFFAQRSARPIREIVGDVLSFGGRRMSGGTGGESRAFSPADFQNDYKYIQHFLSKAGRDLETFNARLVQQEELQRENLFERLLYGLVYSGAAWQTVREYFPGFPPVFRIAAVALSEMEEAALSAHTMRQAMILDIIEPWLSPDSYAHFSGTMLVLLLGEDEAEDLLPRLRSLSADLRKRLNTGCRTALSEPVRELRDIHQAFYLVRHLLRLPPREGFTVEGEEIVQTGNTGLLPFPIELLDASRLYELLLHGEEDKAVDFINTMFYELCRQGYTGENDIQQIFFIYRRAMLQIAGDLELDLSGDEVIPAYDPQLELSFLFARVAEAARKICGRINARHTEKDNSFERQVLRYIDDNLTNTGLYTKIVTDFFHISENRLQAIVRKWTGKSFLEYVESKRMDRSRELLLKTDMSVSRIARDCGYASDNSFYKDFRRFYGQSPTEMRSKPTLS
ncbi:hypothetical protein FACS1894142_6440 [Spirochaetia bacterium]|nr:hypothetical protein FACS1894142_6440 [Spirochaetia bacterium]